MSNSFYVRRIGIEKRKDFINNFVELYDKYEAIAKKINQNSNLIFRREGKLIIFFVKLSPTNEEKYTDDLFTEEEFNNMLIEENLSKTNKKNPNKHNLR